MLLVDLSFESVLCLLSQYCVCVFVSVSVFVSVYVSFLGLPRSLASILQSEKDVMLRNNNVNAIFLCLGVSGGLCACCFP